LGPIPNPQSPIPNPQSPLNFQKKIYLIFLILINILKLFKIIRKKLIISFT